MIGVSDELIYTLLITHFLNRKREMQKNVVIKENNERIEETIIRMIKSPAHKITTSFETNDDVVYINMDKDNGDLNISTTEICHVSAFENGKELSIPYNTVNGIKNTLDMIYNIFDCGIVSHDTEFVVKYKNTKYVVTWCYDDILVKSEVIK